MFTGVKVIVCFLPRCFSFIPSPFYVFTLSVLSVVFCVVIDVLDLFHLKDLRQVEVLRRPLRNGKLTVLDVAVKRLVLLLPSAEQMSEDIDQMFVDNGGSTSGALAAGEFVEDPGDADTNPIDVVVDRKDKRKIEDADFIVGESSCLLKRQRHNDGAVFRSAISGKSLAIIKSLLRSSMLKCEHGVDPFPFVPFVSSCM